jgi:hypothetical protein
MMTPAEAQLLHRAVIARTANAVARASCHGGAPTLSPSSPRADVVAWLAWNDPNGIHSDLDAAREGMNPYTLAGAWEALADMLDSSGELLELGSVH